jgi:N-hydroxyarylamine O-acetyltransferase
VNLDSRAVEAYLARLGVTAPVAAGTPATLALLHERHLRAVPFENLDVVARRRLDYRLGALYDKIVVRRRGGWCLETNWLLGHVLARLGFGVRFTGAGIAAKGGFKNDLSHLLLTVTARGEEYLADVGFGHGGYARPLPARPGRYKQPTGVYQVEGDGDRLIVSRWVDGVAEPMYRTSPGRRHIGDFAATTDFHELSTESPFNTSVHCVRLTAEGWAIVAGDRLLVRSGRTGQAGQYPLTEPDLRAGALAWVLDDAPCPLIRETVPATSPAAPGSIEGEPCKP